MPCLPAMILIAAAAIGGVMYLRTRSHLFSLGGTGKKDGNH